MLVGRRVCIDNMLGPDGPAIPLDSRVVLVQTLAEHGAILSLLPRRCDVFVCLKDEPTDEARSARSARAVLMSLAEIESSCKLPRGALARLVPAMENTRRPAPGPAAEGSPVCEASAAQRAVVDEEGFHLVQFLILQQTNLLANNSSYLACGRRVTVWDSG